MQADPAPHAAATRAARDSYGRLLSLLASRGAGLAEAEDALSDAFLAAMTQWPRDGVPKNPDAWLYTVARRRMIDASRKAARLMDRVPEMAILMEEFSSVEAKGTLPDRRLTLLLACADPEVAESNRTALMLNVVLGLTAEEIAPLYLVSAKTMSQRLVRAKAHIREAGVGFQEPEPELLPERLDPVLDAIYGAYTRSYSVSGYENALTTEAIFLARILANLSKTSEAFGLLSLLLHSEARAPARRSQEGAYIPFEKQDTSSWDLALLREAEAMLKTATGLPRTGRFQLEAAIQSARAAERLTGDDTREAVVRLYDHLHRLHPSTVVSLNRLVARARLSGSKAVIDAVRELEDCDGMADYQPFWAARGALEVEAGNEKEARRAYSIALGLTRDPAVRAWLIGQCGFSPSPSSPPD